jgi:hypothetical protein
MTENNCGQPILLVEDCEEDDETMRRALSTSGLANPIHRCVDGDDATSSDPRDVAACYQIGANSYATKPVDLNGLMSAIQRLHDYWFQITILPRPSDVAEAAPSTLGMRG